VSSNAFVFNGIWFHANFLAKRKGATNCVDLVPKYFFAEIESRSGGHSCVSCVKLDQGVFHNTSFTFCSQKYIFIILRGLFHVYITDFTLVGDPKNIGGCTLCSEKMMHPAGGRYHGAQTRTVRHAPGGLQISFNF
jgi:hypothetical protein